MGTGSAAGRPRVRAGLAQALIGCGATALVLASLRWPGAFDLLVLERADLARGQLWRLWTGHLAHLDVPHAGLNLAAAAVLTLFAWRQRELPALLRASAVMMPLLSLVVLALMPAQMGYAGLSGLLHGWTTWLLVRRGGWPAGVGLTVLAIKLALESLPDYPAAHAFPVVLDAHRAGAVIGLILGALRRRSTTMQAGPRSPDV